MSSKSKSETTPNGNNNSNSHIRSKLSSSPATPTPRVTSKVSPRGSGGVGVPKSEAAAADSPNPSPLQNHPRASLDRSSPRTLPSSKQPAPLADRRSPKLTTTTIPPSDKQSSRILKGSELLAQLTALQEDLKKAKDKLALVEKEKAKAIAQLKDAQKLSEDANEKLREAIVAQKRAEDSSEIEKFRAVEMEQTGIESAQKKEEQWLKELEDVRKQHALDVAALLSSAEELQKVKQELAMTCDAKNQALSHADDATKIAEIHADKAETLSAELVCLKALLDSKEANDSGKLVSQLKLQIESLHQELEKSEACEDELKLQAETLTQELDKAKTYEDELKVQAETLKEELNKAKAHEDELKIQTETLTQEIEKAKSYEEKCLEREAIIEELNMELEAARMAESYARSLMEEWKTKVQELDAQTEEAKRLERFASESLESVMKQLEGSNDMLQDAESEIASLKEKVGLLEMSIGRQRGDLEESERNLGLMKEEASELAKVVESLKSELESVKEEKTQALNNEKLAAASVQTLLEEKNKLISELESSRDEEEKSKKAMESLASALHEVSLEAREAKERLLCSQAEHENYGAQIDDLKRLLKGTTEKYENMLDVSKHEIDILMHSIEQAKRDYKDSEAEWKEKELHLMDRVKKSEEENSSTEGEITRMIKLLKVTEEEVCAAKEEEVQLKNYVKEAESEVIYLKEVLGETKAESMRMKESLLDKENELQGVVQENDELRTREEVSMKKIEELSKLLEDAIAKRGAEENGNVTDSEKDYDLLPKVVEFSEQNGDGKVEKPKIEQFPNHFEHHVKENLEEENNALHEDTVQKDIDIIDLTGGNKVDEKLGKENDDSVEVEFKMWESCKIEDRDFSPEREGGQDESFEEELDSKTEGGEGYDQINGLSTETPENGGTSPSKQQQLKKKKLLLHKFGSLLKKKGTSNQK